MNTHDLYLTNRDFIERALGHVCRRQRLAPSDAEDFRSSFVVHLMEDDYRVLRAFEGRSSLSTYLATVITRYFQDWRNAKWGKWRPSAAARRLGDLAVALETLTVRDGLTLAEAHQTLSTNRGVQESSATLEALAAQFPVRTRRTVLGDEMLDQRPAPDGRADSGVSRREAAAVARASAKALATAVARLDPQDRLVLRMRYEDDVSVADIARVLQLEAKPLYRRLDRLTARLRADLESAGLTRAAVEQALDERGFDQLAIDRLEAGETAGGVRPFNRRGSPADPSQGVRAE